MAQYLTTATQDHAKNPGYTVPELENFLGEIEIQPVWRPEADRAAEYYDGKQLDGEYVNEIRDRGIAPLVFNHVAPAIDGVLGLEAKTRADWVVRADNEAGTEVAQAMNEKLYEAAELTDANRYCSDSHAAQVKTGLGWVEVNRCSDPFQYRYRCNYVHRREIHWDWHATRPDLKDARYLVRDRWVDEDIARLAFPQHERLIEVAFTGWHNWAAYKDNERYYEELYHAYSEYSASTLNENLWLDTYRKMIRLYEVWYRKWVRGVALQLNDGSTVKYDKMNKAHNIAVAMGHGRLVSGTYPEMRLSYYLGPHRVMDIPSPLPHDNFPYIPFWGFREDKTGIPYGLIRRMFSPQDEINARRSKMMWLLSAKRIIMDADATNMSPDEVLDEVQRPDSLIITNENRVNRNKDALRVEQDFTLAKQQFDVMKSAEDAIHDVSGIRAAMLGDSTGDQSGVAISSLIEQSSTSLAEIMDNFRYARRLVGEHLLALIVEDMGDKQEEVVVNANKPQRTKRIQLNERVMRDDGKAIINNDVVRTKTIVSLGDIQSTAGYRNQIFSRLTELAMTLPDDMKAGIMDIVFEMADVPEKDQLVKRLQELSGRSIDIEDMDDQERAEYEAKQAAEAKAQQQAYDEVEAKIDHMKSQSIKLKSEAESNRVDDAKTQAETEQILQEMKALTAQINELKEGFMTRQKEDTEANRASMEAEGLLAQLAALGSAEKPEKELPEPTHRATPAPAPEAEQAMPPPQAQSDTDQPVAGPAE